MRKHNQIHTLGAPHYRTHFRLLRKLNDFKCTLWSEKYGISFSYIALVGRLGSGADLPLGWKGLSLGPPISRVQNFGTKDSVQHFCKQSYLHFCFGSTHVFFTMPLAKDLCSRAVAILRGGMEEPWPPQYFRWPPVGPPVFLARWSFGKWLPVTVIGCELHERLCSFSLGTNGSYAAVLL